MTVPSYVNCPTLTTASPSCAAGGRAVSRVGELPVAAPGRAGGGARLLAGELPEVGLPDEGAVGGARVAQVGVVRPHHDGVRAGAARRGEVGADAAEGLVEVAVAAAGRRGRG